MDKRLVAYAARVARLVTALPGTLVGRRIGDQLLRAGRARVLVMRQDVGARSADGFSTATVRER